MMGTSKIKSKLNEELLISLFDNFPLPVFVKNRNSDRIFYVNKSALRKYGYKKNYFLRLKYSTLLLYSNKTLKRLPSDVIHQVHKIKSGKIINVHVTTHKIIYEGKNCELIIIHDISEQTLLTKKLVNAEMQLRITLYSIGDGVITTDEKGRVRIMNAVAEKLTGWKESEAKGKPLTKIFNIVNEYTRRKVENPFSRVLREGIVVGLANHIVLISKNGKEIPIMDCGAPIRDVEGNINGVVLVFRDQTKEREAQRKIEEEKIFAESIIATVREPLLVLNSKMIVVAANKSFYNTFNTTEAETIGKSLYNLGNGQWNIPSLKELLEKILTQNTAFNNIEVLHNFPKIGQKTMLLNARRIYREKNKTDFILLAIEDITERKIAEEKIKKLNRMYRLLSTINQTIVRVRDSKELLDEITRLTVEIGEFSASWFAMKNGNLNSISIYSSYNLPEEYISQIKKDFYSDSKALCPIMKVLKTGRYFVSNNLLKVQETF